MKWATDGTVSPLAIELFGALVEQVFGSGGNNGFKVVVVSYNLAQVQPDKGLAGDGAVGQFRLHVRRSRSQRVDGHGEVGEVKVERRLRVEARTLEEEGGVHARSKKKYSWKANPHHQNRELAKPVRLWNKIR